MTASDRTAIVVGASADELAHVQECLPDWRCLVALLDDEEISISMIPEGAELAVVYARQSEAKTLAICNQLRRAPRTSAVPILLVISKYAIVQGKAAKRLGNAAFIIPPFSGKEIHDRITQCFDVPHR